MSLLRYISMMVIILSLVTPGTVAHAQTNNFIPLPASGSCPAGYNPSIDLVPEAFGGTGVGTKGCLRTASTDPTNRPPGPIACSEAGLTSGPTIWFTCLGRMVAAGTGSALISLAAWLLGISGYFLNWLIDASVVDFTARIWASAGPATEKAWTFFRDLANIGIIGLFTFIAISIILGLEKFGQKKLIARVLIIALLINFSLLFSKMVVSSSNFVAKAFYCASLGKTAPACDAAANATGNAVTTGNGITYASDGLAGRFIKYMAVATIGDSYIALRDMAEKSDSGGTALIHGLVAALLLFIAAFLFFYAIILLLTRLILLIILMAISAFAFTAYLIPGLDDKFRLWWETLIRTAFFAPLLMMFFWMTLTIAEGFKLGNNSLGGILTMSPQASFGSGIPALFGYAIVIGMMFASIRFAASFSKHIAGMSMATGLGLGLSAYGIGAVGRNVFGRLGALQVDRKKSQIEEMNARNAFERSQGRIPDLRPLRALERQKGAAEARAKSTYNPLKTQPVKDAFTALGGSAGMLKRFGGGTSFEEYAKKSAEAAKKMAESTVIDEKAARKAVETGRIAEHKDLASEHSRNEEVLKKAEEAASKAIKASDLPSKKSAAENTAREEQKKLQEMLGKIGEKMSAATKTGDAEGAAAAREEHAAAFRAGEARIKAAREEALAHSAGIDAIRKQAHTFTVNGKLVESTIENAKAMVDDSSKRMTGVAKDMAEASKLAAPDIAAREARGFGGRIFNTDDYVAQRARKGVNIDKMRRIKQMREMAELRAAASVGEKKTDTPAEKKKDATPASDTH